MQIGHIHIQNFRSLKDLEVSISTFACIIGENNSGKSSLLEAFVKFLKGQKLDSSDYYDESEEVVIAVRFDEVGEEDLQLLEEGHRNKVRQILEDGTLTLVRRFQLGESPVLRCKRSLPREEHLRETVYNEKFKGTKGAQIREILTNEYPNVVQSNEVSNVTAQSKAKELIEQYVSNLPREEFVLDEADLPSGIPASVSALLPEPVFIEAVKDLSDDVKTTQQATFGKLLGILLEAIAPELGEVNELFYELEKRLNLLTQPDGNHSDERLPEVRRIENMIQQYLRETFADVGVELVIPPPDLKTVLGNAGVAVDDGVKGDSSTKGDGLRRAVTFAIFRSLAELSTEGRENSIDRNNRFLFLFEEPELYLHPKAQRELFDALSRISRQHQVVLSTHSPYFFRIDNTDRFIKMTKETAIPKPATKRVQLDLSHWEYRDLFQIVSFETSNSAFFSGKIILVEGDSELIVLPHVARLLNENWNFTKHHISLVKTSGKGSISRYKKFFAHFNIDVVVIADLDILEQGFDQLDVDEKVKVSRSRLIQEVDKVIQHRISTGDLVSQGKVKGRLARGDQQALWAKIQRDVTGYDNGDTDVRVVIDSFDRFLTSLRTVRRRDVLQDHSETEILQLKRRLLAQLRNLDIYVWEKGSIDNYIPDNIGPKNIKPERAYNFCRETNSREHLNSLCDRVQNDGRYMSEFELVFSSIFAETSPSDSARDELVIE